MGDEGDIGLEDAYGLKEPEDSVRLYGKWAKTYDTDFVEAVGYIYPEKLVEVFARVAGEADVPVLDAGCGTGLVAEALKDVSEGAIDGLDISPEMLEVARDKELYRNLVAGNLLEVIDLPDNTYGAVVSVGTFTHGHVGPGGLDELIRVAKPGGLFVIGVNAQHFEAMNFGDYLNRAKAAGRIGEHDIQTISYYDRKDHEHADDVARVLIFRKS